MNDSEQIVTLVRSYCMSLIQTGMSTQQTIGKALVHGVEYLVGEQSQSIDEIKNKIKELGQQSLKQGTVQYSKPGHLKQIEKARKDFVQYVDRLDVKAIGEVKPLPYRRRLRQIESKAVRENLQTYWNFEGYYWEPLINCSPSPVYFYDTTALEILDIDNLVNILTKITRDRIFEVSEDRLDYEIDISQFDVDSIETVYTDKFNKWIIYLSHEGTIAFGGGELMNEFDKVMTYKSSLKDKW